MRENKGEGKERWRETENSGQMRQREGNGAKEQDGRAEEQKAGQAGRPSAF